MKEAEDIYMHLQPIVPEKEAVPMPNTLCVESSLCEHLLKTKRNREQGEKGIPAREVLAKMDAVIDSVGKHK